MVKLCTVRPSPRFAVVVPKKVAATAVRRNLIKRRIREAVRAVNMFSTSLPRVTIVALPPIVGKAFQEIKSAVEHAMKHL